MNVPESQHTFATCGQGETLSFKKRFLEHFQQKRLNMCDNKKLRDMFATIMDLKFEICCQPCFNISEVTLAVAKLPSFAEVEFFAISVTKSTWVSASSRGRSSHRSVPPLLKLSLEKEGHA